jgi:hypothetical protein
MPPGRACHVARAHKYATETKHCGRSQSKQTNRNKVALIAMCNMSHAALPQQKARVPLRHTTTSKADRHGSGVGLAYDHGKGQRQLAFHAHATTSSMQQPSTTKNKRLKSDQHNKGRSGHTCAQLNNVSMRLSTCILPDAKNTAKEHPKTQTGSAIHRRTPWGWP